MDKELVAGKIGTVGDYGAHFVDGKLQGDIEALVGPFSIDLKLGLDAVDVLIAGLEWAKVKIPGPVDDLIFDQVINVLKDFKAKP